MLFDTSLDNFHIKLNKSQVNLRDRINLVGAQEEQKQTSANGKY